MYKHILYKTVLVSKDWNKFLEIDSIVTQLKYTFYTFSKIYFKKRLYFGTHFNVKFLTVKSTLKNETAIVSVKHSLKIYLKDKKNKILFLVRIDINVFESFFTKQ